MEIEIIEGVRELPAASWDALTDGFPLLSHAFLTALEDTHCVGKGTGWQPNPLVVREQGQLIGAVPLYLKGHSYGEYVFDWSWADAYERNGQRYYPKIIAAIPFTPITSPRLLTADPELRLMMAEIVADQLARHGLSSAHVLFPDDASAAVMREAGWIERQGVQFRWENAQFVDFEDFLSRLSHDKRKKIHQERKKVAAAGIECRRILGPEITREAWDFFYRCYEHTYHQHHSTPYLTKQFFHEIGQRMPQHVLLNLAYLSGEPVAASLNIYDDHALYGRYWGAVTHVPGLHFELCYYQAQEFCIERGISCFEGGAQGEHKLARGFKPRTTYSFHKIAHPDFEDAIKRFLQQETQHIAHYRSELEERAPFKHPQS